MSMLEMLGAATAAFLALMSFLGCLLCFRNGRLQVIMTDRSTRPCLNVSFIRKKHPSICGRDHH